MYGDLLILDGKEARVVRQSSVGRGATEGFTERRLRDCLFENPVALPFGAIDPSYEGSIPICREMRTEAGPIDALFANERGLLTVLECKLWRNPEARREVVGQVLDYARAMASMTYEDLSRQVNMALRSEGNTLFEMVRREKPDLEEHTWGDQVSRNLAQGRLLLMVAGDGIQEGVVAITEQLQRGVGLRFHFGLVEVAVFKAAAQNVILQPRLLARTVTVERSVVRIERGAESEGVSVVDADDAESARGERVVDPATVAARKEFWDRFIEAVKLEGGLDSGPRKLQQNSVKARLPLGQWITAYRAESIGQIGLWFQSRGDQAPEISRHLRGQRAEIEPEIALPIEWEKTSDGDVQIRASLPAEDFVDAHAQQVQHEWLAKYLKAFTRALGPRLREIESEIAGR
jgi:hypothetical protein